MVEEEHGRVLISGGEAQRKAVGAVLSAARAKARLSRVELAALVGGSPSRIKMWETGARSIPEAAVPLLAKALAETGLTERSLRWTSYSAKDGSERRPLANGMAALGAPESAPPIAQASRQNDPPNTTTLLHQVLSELTAHLRRMDENEETRLSNERLRIETVEAPQARAREQAESNVKSMLGLIGAPQPDNGPGGDGDEMAATIEGPAPARRAT